VWHSKKNGYLIKGIHFSLNLLSHHPLYPGNNLYTINILQQTNA
jgi:hypothetical protein